MFIENLDKFIEKAELTEGKDDSLEKKNRSVYHLTDIRAWYINRYDWYDTVYQENGKKGLKDLKGQVVVPAKYDAFKERSHFLYTRDIPRIAQLHGKVGLVKAYSGGEELTPFDFDDISFMIILPYFTVKKGEKLGIVGKDGSILVPTIIDEVHALSGNCAIFKANGKYGLIDSSCGDLYVPPQFDDVEIVDMEQPYIVTKNGVEGVINETGTFMTIEDALDYEGYLVGDFCPDF